MVLDTIGGRARRQRPAGPGAVLFGSKTRRHVASYDWILLNVQSTLVKTARVACDGVSHLDRPKLSFKDPYFFFFCMRLVDQPSKIIIDGGSG